MEDAMIYTVASAPHRAAWPGTRPAARTHDGPATLQNLVASWRWRMRYRRELLQKARHDPHLLEDIGLTRRQVEAEIAKPFWRR
jgi:uncharacterized protein YjiS (DUF1127 family)